MKISKITVAVMAVAMLIVAVSHIKAEEIIDFDGINSNKNIFQQIEACKISIADTLDIKPQRDTADEDIVVDSGHGIKVESRITGHDGIIAEKHFACDKLYSLFTCKDETGQNADLKAPGTLFLDNLINNLSLTMGPLLPSRHSYTVCNGPTCFSCSDSCHLVCKTVQKIIEEQCGINGLIPIYCQKVTFVQECKDECTHVCSQQ